jgi:hypothetical protein
MKSEHLHTVKTSLVVPGMSDTIATFLLANRLRRLLFPALGGPFVYEVI